jgi:hypothetical protein
LPGAISRASLGKTGSAAYFLPHIIFNNEVSSF